MERQALIPLLVEIQPDQLATVGDQFGIALNRPAPDWSDPRSVIDHLESASLDMRDSLIPLRFTDALAHEGPTRVKITLHQWVERVGLRLGYDQGIIRGLCISSRAMPGNQSAPHDQQVAAVPLPDDDAVLQDAVAEPSEEEEETVRTYAVNVPSAQPLDLPRIWGGVPFRNPHFTGREPLLCQLRDELAQHRKASVLPQTIHGFGGVGKTQLAIEYVYRYGDDYNLVWWITADRRARITGRSG